MTTATTNTTRRTARRLPIASILIRKDWRRNFALMDAACEALDSLAPSVTEGQHNFQMQRWNDPKGSASTRNSAENEMWRLLNEFAPKGHEFRCGKAGWELVSE